MLSSSPPSPPSSSFGLSAESSAPAPSPPSPTIDTPLSSHPSITITSHEPLRSTVLSYKADPAFAGSSLVHFVDESDDLENARACLAEWGKKNKGRTDVPFYQVWAPEGYPEESLYTNDVRTHTIINLPPTHLSASDLTRLLTEGVGYNTPSGIKIPLNKNAKHHPTYATFQSLLGGQWFSAGLAMWKFNRKVVAGHEMRIYANPTLKTTLQTQTTQASSKRKATLAAAQERQLELEARALAKEEERRRLWREKERSLAAAAAAQVMEGGAGGGREEAERPAMGESGEGLVLERRQEREGDDVELMLMTTTTSREERVVSERVETGGARVVGEATREDATSAGEGEEEGEKQRGRKTVIIGRKPREEGGSGSGGGGGGEVETYKERRERKREEKRLKRQKAKDGGEGGQGRRGDSAGGGSAWTFEDD